MNVNMRRFLWPGLPILIGVVSIVCLLLFRAQFQQVQDENRAARQALWRLQNRTLYPSDENVEAVRRAVERMEFRIGELKAGLSGDPFSGPAAGPAAFSARVQRAVERLQQRAEAAGTRMADSLEAGFPRYASGGMVPESPHVPRLSRQLDSVERVLDVLIRSKVTAIDSVGRDSFEQEEPRRSSRIVRGRNSGKEEGLHLKASRVHPEGYYTIEQIEVTFTADEKALWRALDGLAASPHFMTPVGLAHQVQTDILDYNPAAIKRGADSEDERLSYLAEGILSGAQALTRSERILVGNDPVRVQLMVNVYDFLSEGDLP